MRGFFDFETWDWIYPLCIGFAWGEPGNRKMHYHVDKAHASQGPTLLPSDSARYSPDSVVDHALTFLEESAERGIDEWWAHNMGKFDGLFICEGAARRGWSIQAAMAGSRMVVLSLMTDTGTRIVLKDSIAVVPGKLGTIAEDWKLQHAKLFTNDDYSVDTRLWSGQRLREGCLTDCLVGLELLESVETQVESWGGSLKSTFSSVALSVLQAQLKEQGMAIPQHKGFQRQNDFCRNAYYGARVEVIHHAPEHLLVEYDVCSSYPWSMTQSMPWELVGPSKNSKGLMKIFSGEYEGVLRARVTVPECEYPPLPFRPGKGGVYFPVGTWEANFVACELRYAVEQGCQVRLLDGVAYTKAQPFSEFVNKIYELKDTSKGAVRNFCKLVLNGCYGKFGQSPSQESLVIVTDSEEADRYIRNARNGRVSKISDDPRFLTAKTYRWPKQTHYAIAAYITAHSRILLHRGMVASTGLAYLDTDSLHCAQLEFDENVRYGQGLGDFKVEIPSYKGRFYAPKMYHLEERPDWALPSGYFGPRGKEHFACKGFPVEREAFLKMVAGDDVEVERMQGIKTQLKKGGKVFRFCGELAEKKKWKGRSSKRFPYPDGSTRPWNVTEIEAGEHEKAVSPMGYNG